MCSPKMWTNSNKAICYFKIGKNFAGLATWNNKSILLSIIDDFHEHCLLCLMLLCTHHVKNYADIFWPGPSTKHPWLAKKAESFEW